MSGSQRHWTGDAVVTTVPVGTDAPRLVSVLPPQSTGPLEDIPRVNRRSWVEWAADRRAERDRQQVLHIVEEIDVIADPVGRLLGLLGLVCDLLEAEVCCFQQYEMPVGRRTTLLWPDETVVVRADRNGPADLAAPQSISPTEYRTLFAPLPVPHQLAIPLRLDPTAAIGCTAGRRVRPFRDDEQSLATALQLALTPLRLCLQWPGPPPPARSLLTAREQEILAHLATGMTARAIGRALDVSPRTVYKHLEHMYAKLGVNDRLSAVTQAQALGLLPLPIRQMSAEPRPVAYLPAVEPGLVPPPVPAARPLARRSPPPPPQIVPAVVGG